MSARGEAGGTAHQSPTSMTMFYLGAQLGPIIYLGAQLGPMFYLGAQLGPMFYLGEQLGPMFYLGAQLGSAEHERTPGVRSACTRLARVAAVASDCDAYSVASPASAIGSAAAAAASPSGGTRTRSSIEVHVERYTLSELQASARRT